jgi:hypothetical protein
MGINRYKPHLLVLPEDDSNRQIANGFILNPSLNERLIQVLPPTGGWTKVVDMFSEVHVTEMYKYIERRVLLLIDFDNQPQMRLSHIQNQIPIDLNDRVFVLGTLSEPESLRTNLRQSFERIGNALAQDCVNSTETMWGHALLSHNKTELDRMTSFVKPFLFS